MINPLPLYAHEGFTTVGYNGTIKWTIFTGNTGF